MSIKVVNLVQTNSNLNDLSLPKSELGTYARAALEAPTAARAEDSLYVASAPNKYEGLRRTYQTSIDAMNRLPAEQRDEQMYPGMQIVKAQLGAWEQVLGMNLPALQNGIPADAALIGKLVQTNGKISYNLTGLKLGSGADTQRLMFGGDGILAAPSAAGVYAGKA